MDTITAHKFSSKNRESIIKSSNCGCFNCLEIFATDKVKDYIEDTALCPKCNIDSVICDNDINFDKQFLQEMNKIWFA